LDESTCVSEKKLINALYQGITLQEFERIHHPDKQHENILRLPASLSSACIT